MEEGHGDKLSLWPHRLTTVEVNPSRRVRFQFQVSSFGLSVRSFFNASSDHAPGWIQRMIANTTAATRAEAGMVRIQAHTILRAMPQRTADKRLVAPTPTIAPVMV